MAKMEKRPSDSDDAMQVDPRDGGPLTEEEAEFISELIRQGIIQPLWEHVEDGTWPPREKFILRFDFSWHRYDDITQQFVELYVRPKVNPSSFSYLLLIQITLCRPLIGSMIS